jgi:isopenicillin N synthase-like dioxygenase
MASPTHRFAKCGTTLRDLPHYHPDNFASVDGHNQWPSEMPLLQPVMMAYLAASEAVALDLLTAFAVGMGAGPQDLHGAFGADNTSFIRMNRYPLNDPLPPAEVVAVTELGDMALHHHTDAEAFTLLLQDDVGGLQAHDAESGWIDVEPIPGALVVNSGDIMQVWSNDRYQAALHRVTPVSDRERFSLPYFFNPSYPTDYGPLIDPRLESHRYRPIHLGRFRQARADGDFADFHIDSA